MKNKFMTAALLSALLLGSTLQGCKNAFEDDELEIEPEDKEKEKENVEQQKENLEDVVAATAEESPDDYVFDLATANKIICKGSQISVEGKGSEASGAEAKITKSGCYIVEGSLSDGRLTIDLDKSDKGIVKLVLNGASITSSTGAALKIKTCPKVSILLNDGTSSKLASTTAADTSAALQSSQSIYLSAGEKGTGKLEISSIANQAIKTSDGIIIKSGTYAMTSEKNDGITAKDFIKIDGGTITVKAYQHAMKTTSAKEDKGFVYITGGNLDLESLQPASEDNGRDAIHSEGTINILGGTIRIKSNDDGISSSAHITIKDGAFGIEQCDKCITALGNITIEGGTYTLKPKTVLSQDGGDGHGITVKKSSSGKRLGSVAIKGGTINIPECYEGIQGLNVSISGGTIFINSLDDAINASAGSSSTGFGGRPGGMPGGMPEASGLEISGGFLMAKAMGDGIDSNGDLLISGGTVLISQSGKGNEAIDVGEGCQAQITGGVVIAAGDRGMSSVPQATQTALFASISGKAGQVLAINSGSGSNIMAWKVPQDYSTITISAPELPGGSCSIITDASIEGSESVEESGFYYPAQKATGTGTQATLAAGKMTSI